LNALGIHEPSSAYDVYALSLWLGTSYVATAQQLSITRTIPRRAGDAWSKIAPRRLKRGLAGRFVPDDMRNDVWWLDGRHSHERIEARPGDRVVLMLDEAPSTGYSWSIRDLPTDVRVVADSYEDDWEPELLTDAVRDQDDLDGGSHPRCFILEIDRNFPPGDGRITLSKGKEWTPGDQIDEFEVQLRVVPQLHGVQLPERELVLA
jgi:hypothetical protein